MEEQSKQHVQVPDPKPTGTNLKPFDYLVYANIRRYMNHETLVCFPSLKTIAEKCDSTIPTIRKSIKHLANEGLFSVTTCAGKPTTYRFEKLLENFERFTPEFLDREDLTADEKAYLIGLQAKSYKTETLAITTYPNSKLANELHMSLSTVQRLNKSLKEKEIMKEIEASVRDEANLPATAKTVDLQKIGQAVLFINERVDNHEVRITQLEKLINMATKENEKLRTENKHLRDEIRRSTVKDAIY